MDHPLLIIPYFDRTPEADLYNPEEFLVIDGYHATIMNQGRAHHWQSGDSPHFMASYGIWGHDLTDGFIMRDGYNHLPPLGYMNQFGGETLWVFHPDGRSLVWLDSTAHDDYFTGVMERAQHLTTPALRQWLTLAHTRLTFLNRWARYHPLRHYATCH